MANTFEVKVNSAELKRVQQMLKDLGNGREARNAVAAASRAPVAALRKRALNDVPEDSGTLKRNFAVKKVRPRSMFTTIFRVGPRNRRFSLSGGRGQARDVNPVKYAHFTESGFTDRGGNFIPGERWLSKHFFAMRSRMIDIFTEKLLSRLDAKVKK